MNSHDYGLKISTGPAAAVASTATAKTWMRISHSDEDTLVDSLITRATNYVENETRRQLINATYTFSWGIPDPLDGRLRRRHDQRPRKDLSQVGSRMAIDHRPRTSGHDHRGRWLRLGFDRCP
jgi:hypothetical protein